MEGSEPRLGAEKKSMKRNLDLFISFREVAQFGSAQRSGR